MLALGVFQALLNAIGWVLARIYDLVGNYGLSIIVLTIVIKVVLLPLGVKQIKSMQAMQSIQPKVKELQKKFKGNKAKIQEETMKLYKEAGVNPLGRLPPPPPAVPDPHRDVRRHTGAAASARRLRRPAGGERPGHGLSCPQQPPARG